MDIKELMADSKRRLINNDLVYRERVDVVLALLRALGVLSHSRISINGLLHRVFAGALISAYENQTPVELYSRRQADIFAKGHSTRLIAWLDKCVTHGVLVPETDVDYAKGKLDTGPILKHYIQYAARKLHHPTQRGLENVLAA